VAGDAVETEGLGDDSVKERAALAPLPEVMAEDLRLELGAMRKSEASV